MFEIINDLFDDKINEFNNKLNVIDTSYSKYKVLKDKIRLVMENYNNLLNISNLLIVSVISDNTSLLLDNTLPPLNISLSNPPNNEYIIISNPWNKTKVLLEINLDKKCTSGLTLDIIISIDLVLFSSFISEPII